MRDLPLLVLRMPRILYAAAILFFLWSFGLTLFEINATMGYVEPGNPVARLSMLRGLFQATLEAVYVAVNGVLVHILIAIWRNTRRAEPPEAGE